MGSNPACWERLDLGNELPAKRTWGSSPSSAPWVTPGSPRPCGWSQRVAPATSGLCSVGDISHFSSKKSSLVALHCALESEEGKGSCRDLWHFGYIINNKLGLPWVLLIFSLPDKMTGCYHNSNPKPPNIHPLNPSLPVCNCLSHHFLILRYQISPTPQESQVVSLEIFRGTPCVVFVLSVKWG